MRIELVSKDKKKYLDLLLIADEQEDMIDRYLDKGDLYVLQDGGVKGVCVVTDEGEGIYEIKNIATHPDARGKGYGRRLIDFVVDTYQDRGHTLLVGTGESPLTVPFYERCGFVLSHRIKDFFLDNYDHPIFECGVQLKDMVYLKRPLSGQAKKES
jgi:GNAT superfamily N-acetyltransferase